jgi:hypothetical protein
MTSVQLLGAYLVISLQSIHFLAQRCSADKGGRIMLIYSAFMLGVVVTWYCVGASYNSVFLVEGLMDPTILRALTTCDALGITRQLFDTLMVWGGDGLLVRRTISYKSTVC